MGPQVRKGRMNGKQAAQKPSDFPIPDVRSTHWVSHLVICFLISEKVKIIGLQHCLYRVSKFVVVFRDIGFHTVWLLKDYTIMADATAAKRVVGEKIFLSSHLASRMDIGQSIGSPPFHHICMGAEEAKTKMVAFSEKGISPPFATFFQLFHLASSPTYLEIRT